MSKEHPASHEPPTKSRELVFEADVSSVTPYLKLATVSLQGKEHMTFASDEPRSIGGLSSAPTPLMYFSAAIAF